MPITFPVRAHAWVAGQVPSRGCMRGNHTLMFLSLSPSLSLCLKINKSNHKKICTLFSFRDNAIAHLIDYNIVWVILYPLGNQKFYGTRFIVVFIVVVWN